MFTKGIEKINLWVRITLAWLAITALLGVFLRLLILHPSAWIAYGNLLHGHSHVAFLGWIFNALFIFLVGEYLLSQKNRKYYHRIFIAMQVLVGGMLVLFPFVGYNSFTIAISFIHTVLTVIVAIRFYGLRPEFKGVISYDSFSIALIFMLVSALGPLMIAPISVMGMKDTIWYKLAIYFYLHFQYNGWFFFGVMGLFFRMLEVNRVPFSHNNARKFIYLNAMAVVPSFALSAIWVSPPDWVFASAVTGTAVQLISLVFLSRILRETRVELWRLFQSHAVRFLLILVVGMIFLRNVLQLAASIPAMADIAMGNRFVVIAFLHLNFLGIITPLLLIFFMHAARIQSTFLIRLGITLFLIGFFISEVILVMVPVYIPPDINVWLLVFSMVMTAGLLLWVIPVYKRWVM